MNRIAVISCGDEQSFALCIVIPLAGKNLVSKLCKKQQNPPLADFMTEIIIIITAATSDTISLEQALEKAKIRNYDKEVISQS